MIAIEELQEENAGDRSWILDTEDPKGDPLTVLLECEEIDLEQNLEHGTTFKEFLETERSTH